jgi:signal transduction histidine kinase/DNA-binding NarL/FixJ family response regulator
MELKNTDDLFGSELTADDKNQKLFTDEPEKEALKKPSKKLTPIRPEDVWIVLVVDDEEDVHSVTRMALKGFAFKDKEIKFLHTYSAKESKKVLADHKDIALIFLDVVMESNTAGLDLVKYIRNKLNNHFTQIVLRTGYPGYAPEREVIAEYEINDYKTKTELTTFKLFTVTLASLRAYDAMIHLDKLRQNLEVKVSERTAELEHKNIQIMEMDQMKTRFFSNVSHEFRTPLTLIISPIENMLLKENLDEKDRDDLELMYRNALRLMGLVNQLLDLSKIDAGKLKIELTEYDIYKALRIFTRGYVPLAERKRIHYVVQIPDGQFITLFDADKLEKIMTNLLTNAFKFTPEKGKVECAIRFLQKDEKRKTDTLEIVVKDTGCGIQIEQLGKVFERFYMAEGSCNTGMGGTGIGLSLTKELIILQHGEIELESKVNEGSRFRVSLPLGKEHLNSHEYELKKTCEIQFDFLLSKYHHLDEKDSEKREDDTINEETDKPVVLIVDDNAEIRQHVHDKLGGHFIVREAADGKEGLEKSLTLVPDLILSDIMMPKMNGIELCKTLKTDEKTSHIPVILLTAKGETEDKLEGLETGADDYITKPFNLKELQVRIKNLIEQRKKLREHYTHQITLKSGEVSVESADDRFLHKALEVIDKNMNDCQFDVNKFYPEMGMSRMQLFRKLKALINQTPSEFIRNMRLQRAAQLIKQDFGNVAEVTFEVGFNNLSYFSKCFKDKFGMLPSEYQK